ncbi:MAG: flagellar biosynthesis protein FlhA [Acetobacteraceae bacterium]|jgi:flagellar biosynthesis protein FlhA
MAEAALAAGFLPTLTARLRQFSPGSDIGLALGVVALLSVLVLPLPPLLLDFGLSVSLTAAVLVLMVSLFLKRPLDFSSFPTLLLLTTLLRLSLNVATTRLILSHGNEGPLAAGHVVAAFGGFLMGGDVVIGLILFSILLVVNFMVITKGSGRIAEVAARFSLDSMPGKQMAIDAEMSAGMIDEKTARRRRKDLEEESGFYGAMDGAAKFVRGDAIAGLIITVINILGGLTIGVVRHGMPLSDAIAAFTTLTAGDGLVTQIPALLVSTAAGIVVTKGGMEGSADAALIHQLGGSPKPLAMAAGAATVLALLPGLPMLPFLTLAGLAGGGAWLRHTHPTVFGPEPAPAPVVPTEQPISETLRIDLIRIELGYGLLSLAGGETARLTEQIKGLRRSIAGDMGFVLPPVRIQDNMQLPADTYSVRIKEIEAGKGELRPTMLLAMDPKGGVPDLPGERTKEPAFGLPALWIDPSAKEEALFRGCTVVDPPSVLTTHLTELVRENVAELLSYAETQKLLDELPREQQKLVADIVPSQITVGAVQRVLQSLLSERVSIRDLSTILEGIQEACGGAARAIPAIVAHVRMRLARQISDSHTGPNGYIPLITLSPEWEGAFAEALTGPPEERQLAMAPSKLQAFMQTLRNAFDTAGATGEAPVLLTSGGIRLHVRAIVERIRPNTPVLAQGEIAPRARIRTVGTI